MFNNKKDDESDFCESYKSEILGTRVNKEGNSLFSTIIKLVTILILLVIIIGVSFYGYNYFMNNQKLKDMALPPVSMQVSEDDLIVEDEDPEIENIVEENITLPLIITSQVEEVNDSVVIADEKKKITEVIQKAVEPKKEIKSLEVPTSSPEAKYLEELADLSKEIDKERKQ